MSAWAVAAALAVSDDTNALKLGWGPQTQRWPNWFAAAGVRMVAGTTDSIAAFLATGAAQTGDAVTSLGSTLVVKVLSAVRIDDAAQGVYSHRVGDNWLVGAALAAHFTNPELMRLSALIDPETDSALDYYPLVRPGERFPINDPAFPPRPDPRPADDAAFLHAMFQGMARIEAQSYDLLTALNAPAPVRILTTGGGAACRRNPDLSRQPIARYRQIGKPWPNTPTSLRYMKKRRRFKPMHSSWACAGSTIQRSGIALEEPLTDRVRPASMVD